MNRIPTRTQLILDAFAQGRWAGLTNRFGAQFYDVLLCYWPLAVFLRFLLEPIAFLQGGAITAAVLMGVPAIVAAYQTLRVNGASRVTLGCAIEGVAIVDAASGQGIEFGRAYWRCVLSVLGSALIVPNLLAGFTRRKQSMADLLTRTVVVQYRQNPTPTPDEPVPSRADAARTAFDEGEIAGCWRRIGAQVTDTFLCLLGWMTLGFLLAAAGDRHGPTSALFLSVITLLGPVMWIAYHAFFTGSRLLATPGRDSAGIAVVDATTGGPIGFRRAIMRAVCSLIGAVLLVPSLRAALDARRQSWADRVAHTLVVRHSQRYRGMAKLSESLIVILIIVILASIALPAMHDRTRREHNFEKLEKIEADLAHYASLLPARPRPSGAEGIRLEALGYVPVSRSTHYVLSSAGVLYAAFTLEELTSVGDHRSYLSLSPEYDAATDQTVWHCRYFAFGKLTPPADCEESPDADPASAGLPD